ncbi:MAG: ribonuclease R [Planctomycetaceae bacterium]|jgi:ribonuclease R|nr:ribonuclease R [Planctomycetaceae bacterium]
MVFARSPPRCGGLVCIALSGRRIDRQPLTGVWRTLPQNDKRSRLTLFHFIVRFILHHDNTATQAWQAGTQRKPHGTNKKSKKKMSITNTKKLPAGKSSANLVTGRFQRRPSGIGFVRPRTAIGDDAPVNDIFIPPHWTRDAASGDTVVIEIMKRRPKDDYGRSTKKRNKKNKNGNARSNEERSPCGRVVEILERASNRFVGTYNIEYGWGYVQIDGSVFKRMVPIGDATAGSARTGDKIVVEMIKFPTPHNDGEAVIVEVLGAHGIPGLDTLLILRQFDLPDHFNDSALNAARNEVEKFFKHFPDESAAEKEFIAKKLKSMNRLDLTDEIIITIDPADAKDFDDAVSLEKLSNGNWRLGVHIADVTHFVAKNSPIDKEAVNRATSVYLPDRVIPMLPEVLSNALASLQPNKIRFTKSVFMEYTPVGVLTHTEIYRSAIKSKQRFNYTEVQEFFDNPEKFQRKWQPEIRELLMNLYEIMNVLRKKRFERGSLEMDIPETKIDLDDDGAVIGAHLYPYHDSNRVIEECMLAANEAVAQFIASKNIPFLRRIHSGPSIRKLRNFTDFIRSLEIADLDADELYQDRFIFQRLIDSVRGTPQEYAVNFSLLRSMQKAVYSPEPEGHYALASQCYCHFTSPIRRYPDLAVHRLLDDILDGKSPKPELRELVLLGEHCSDREQRAEEAERELVKLKLIDYVSKHIGERIEAVITTVEMYGVFVMGLEIPAEGLIRIEALNDDFYRFERNAKILIGQRNGNTLRIGDRLLVEIVRADPDTRQIDFRMVKRLKTDKPTAKLKNLPVRREKQKSSAKEKKKKKQ